MTQPTSVTATKQDKAPEPKVKDRFLARLIDVFGHPKGVDLYQKGNVTDDDLSQFVSLVEKFEINTRVLR